MAAITFLPGGTRAECRPGESIFEVARRTGVPVTTACVAKATCGLCRVKVVEGESHLSPFGGPERRHLGNVYFITKIRLSCQARILADDAEIVVEVPHG